MSAAAFRATGLFLWSRNRINLRIVAVCYGVLLIGAALPGVGTSLLFQSMGLGFLLFTPLVFPLLMFVGSGLNANADLMSPESLFPRHFFALPVSARQIVLPFMVYATVFGAAQWTAAEVINDGRVLAFLGGRQWLPPLAMSFVAWMQALLWTPVRRRWVRALQLLALIPPYVFVVVEAARVVWSAELTVALSLVQFPIAYAVAAGGVAKSRRGDPSVFVAGDRHRARRASSKRGVPSLASPLAAQLWIEQRIHRWSGKSFLVALLPVGMLIVLFVAMLAGANGRAVQTVGSAAIYLLFGALVVESISTGTNFGSFQASVPWNQPAGAYSMPAYFAALPLSSGDFAWAKMRAATARMLWVSVAIVLLSALIAAACGYAEAWMADHSAWRSEYGLAATLLLAAVPPLAMVMLSLCATASVMWIILLGRSKDATLLFSAVCLLCVLASRFKEEQIVAFLSAFVPVAAAVKIFALIALVFYVGSRRVLSWTRLVTIVGFWGATAVTLMAWLGCYAPHSLFTPMRAVWTALLVAPVLGTVAAPLALAWNRAR